jgi:3'(2'), 5'-bisphosphate nucleotidase
MTAVRTDARLAADLARQAGELLLELRTGDLTGKQLSDAGDRAANEMLLRELAQHRPDDAVLSEESTDDPVRLRTDRVWIIDPLDGSREYGLPGRADWAVHVAVWQAGLGIIDAAVAQPALDAVYATDDGVAAPAAQRRVILVSDTRPPAFAGEVAAAVGAEVEPMGSAGAKAMAVLRGEAAAYLHSGGQWEWDSAAPVGVALAAGLHASRIDGTPLRYNSAHPYLPDLLICAPDLAVPMLAAIAECAR